MVSFTLLDFQFWGVFTVFTTTKWSFNRVGFTHVTYFNETV